MTDAINPQYRERNTLRAIAAALRTDPRLPSVALGEFLLPKAFRELKAATKTGWKQSGVPDRGMFSTRENVAAQQAIKKYATTITKAKHVVEQNRRFGHRDFILLHDHEEPKPGWRSYFFLDEWDPAWGGRIVFVKDGEYLGVVTPQANTLLIVKQEKGVRMFVEYVNHHAGKNTIRILAN